MSLSFDTQWQSAWRPEYVGTLTFIVRDDEVLLIEKKTGHGAGKINAPGGKLEPGETPAACAVREVQEEVGLTPLLEPCAIELRFVEQDGPQWLGFAFVARDFTGTLTETREALPFWCSLDTIPYPRMWPDDAIWLPRVLAHTSPSKPLVANFLFARGRLLAHEFVDAASVVTSIAGASESR
ncbi:MAG: 8-oxo-dGTP diphosphatase [Pseudomonadota bacterium]